MRLFLAALQHHETHRRLTNVAVHRRQLFLVFALIAEETPAIKANTRSIFAGGSRREN